MKVAAASEINVPVVQIFTVGTLSIVAYFAAIQTQSGSISVGKFFSLITALALLSSLIKRLTKLIVQLQSGLLDGILIQDNYPCQPEKAGAFVGQHIILFNDRFAANIAYGVQSRRREGACYGVN